MEGNVVNLSLVNLIKCVANRLENDSKSRNMHLLDRHRVILKTK
ncbi:hypothetical protein SAMN04487988_101544 [Algoriphagus hitonicola]|uniref:Uncharacterized protein n=1 Tax=Algoriphagus hitonicola TaxID=435880 RepID=A0A1I2PEL9_9BACT|nr:hypothetical protein SAMN04487988_101544 [Algoriphagus hitonicola]